MCRNLYSGISIALLLGGSFGCRQRDFNPNSSNVQSGNSISPQITLQPFSNPDECTWTYEETGIQWAHQNISRPGEGVVLAQLDTGYLPSPHFEIGTDPMSPGLFLADQGRPRMGGVLPVLNWVETAKPSLDYSTQQINIWAHGVSMQGILLNRTSRGALFDGIVPYARVIPYRVSPYVVSGSDSGAPGYSPTRNVARALRNAIAQGVDVVNMSFAAITDTNGPGLVSAPGGLGVSWSLSDTGELRSAFEAAAREGVIVVVAGGQDAPFNFATASAMGPHVVAVAGSRRGLKPWRNSIAIPQILLAAPGHDVCITRPSSSRWNGTFDEAGLTEISKSFAWYKSEGTSYSTTFVSGIAALWVQAHPEIPRAERVAAFRKALEDHGTVTPSDWPASGFGKGVVNARELLKK